MKTQRDSGIDLIKTVAIFFVVMIHCGDFSGSVGSGVWTASLGWTGLARPAVPLFLMCTGALMLPPEKELPLKKLWLRSIPRLVISMLVWAMVYKLAHLFVGGMLSLPSVFQAVKEVLVFNQEFHFYYLHLILLVYVFLPVLRSFTANADRRTIEYALVFWFVTGILYPTVASFWPFTLLTGLAPQYLMNMTYASLGYALLGWYLKTWPPRRSTSLCAVILGYAVVIGGTALLSVRDGALSELFLQGMTVGVCLTAAGLFSLLLRAGEGCASRSKALLSLCSRASFCIYLVHMLVVYAFRHFGFTPACLPAVLAVPVYALCIIVPSFAVWILLSRIPFVKKYLI